MGITRQRAVAGTSLCETISIVSLLYFSASLDSIAFRILVNDVCCLKKQTSFSCGTVPGHGPTAGPREIPFLTICCTWVDFCHHSKIFIIQESGPHPYHAPIRQITEYSVKLAPNSRIVIIFHLDSLTT